MGSGHSSEKRNSVEARHCVPLGLYPKCPWDLRTLRKLILEKRLAPIFKGVDDPPDDVVMDECPICMLFYPGGLNVSRCCKKDICTECFLQMRKPNAPRPTCPFCQREGFEVSFTGPKSAALRAKEEEEDRKVAELQAKVRQEEIERDRKREQERAEAKAKAAEGAAGGASDTADATTPAQHTPPSSAPRGGAFSHGAEYSSDRDDTEIGVELAPDTSAADTASASEHVTPSIDIPEDRLHSFAYSSDFVSEMSAASPAEMEEFMIRQAIALSLGQEPDPLPNSFS